MLLTECQAGREAASEDDPGHNLCADAAVTYNTPRTDGYAGVNRTYVLEVCSDPQGALDNGLSPNWVTSEQTLAWCDVCVAGATGDIDS